MLTIHIPAVVFWVVLVTEFNYFNITRLRAISNSTKVIDTSATVDSTTPLRVYDETEQN